jgi:uncharacterized protein (TIGR03067 family)
MLAALVAFCGGCLGNIQSTGVSLADLQGAWEYTGESNNKVLVIIAGDKVFLNLSFDKSSGRYHIAKNGYYGQLALSTNFTPYQFNLELADKSLGTMEGIFRLDGDVLLVGINKKNEGRPKEFSKEITWVFMRNHKTLSDILADVPDQPKSAP